jgi:hypothetical protein
LKGKFYNLFAGVVACEKILSVEFWKTYEMDENFDFCKMYKKDKHKSTSRKKEKRKEKKSLFLTRCANLYNIRKLQPHR